MNGNYYYLLCIVGISTLLYYFYKYICNELHTQIFYVHSFLTFIIK